MSPEQILISVVSILVFGVSAQWLAWRLGLPSILLLLLFGLLAGPITHIVDPDRLLGNALSPLVSLAVAVVLFEGGLSLKLAELPSIRTVVRNLVTLGLILTWLLGAVGITWMLGFHFRTALLMSALLVVSGPAVVSPLLKQIRPSPHVSAILKWEGILIDPIGVLLALVVFQVFYSAGPGTAALTVLKTAICGGGIGLLSALLLTLLLRRFLVPDQLQNPVVLMWVFVAFTAANLLQEESGLLAVVVLGAVLANQRSAAIEHIVAFKENLRILMLASLFIVLAGRLRPDDLRQIALGSLGLICFLIVIVRPLSVFLCTLGSDLSTKERVFVGWMAPRGIVAPAAASVFAMGLDSLYQAGQIQTTEHRLLVPVAFAVVIGTVSFYGLTAGIVARWLGLSEKNPQGVLIVGADRLGREVAAVLQAQGFRVLLVDHRPAQLATARLEGLPTFRGSIHEDHLVEELDFAGIGRLLALSTDDSVNVLAVHRFREIFGLAGVFQLAPEHSPGEHHTSRDLHGRFLFPGRPSALALEKRITSGGAIKVTHFSDQFSYQEFESRTYDHAIPLFQITAQRRLVILTDENFTQPQSGQSLISLVNDG